MTSMTMSMSVPMSSSFLLLLRRPDISSSVGNLRDVVLLLFVREVRQMTVGGPAQSMAMAMTSSVLVKQTKTDQIDNKSHCSYPQNHLRMVNLLRFVESLQTLHSDGETQGYQENRIDQSSQNLSSSPAKSVFGPRFWRHSDTEKGNYQSCNI